MWGWPKMPTFLTHNEVINTKPTVHELNTKLRDFPHFRVPKMPNTHYHVIAGFHGCLPESNVFCQTLKDARAELADQVKNLRENGNTFNGALRLQYYEISKRTNALCDYLSIEKCNEHECLKWRNE